MYIYEVPAFTIDKYFTETIEINTMEELDYYYIIYEGGLTPLNKESEEFLNKYIEENIND